MSDLVGNPNCWFSHAQAHIINVTVYTDLIVHMLDSSTNTANTRNSKHIVYCRVLSH